MTDEEQEAEEIAAEIGQAAEWLRDSIEALGEMDVTELSILNAAMQIVSGEIEAQMVAMLKQEGMTDADLMALEQAAIDAARGSMN